MSDAKPLPSQLERVEAYFSASAREWQDLYARPRRVNDIVLANRRRLAVDKVRRHARPGARVLDAGCGAGLVSLDLVERGFFVHGVDIAESMLELARKRFEAAHVASDCHAFMHGELRSAGLEPASFGAIVALGFLEYQEDERATLDYFHTLLEPGGVLVVSGPTERKLANYFGLSPRLRRRLEARRLLRPLPALVRVGLHRYGRERFRALLEASHFDVLEIEGHGFVEFEGPLRRLSYDAELALHRALSWAARRVPIGRWGNDTIAVGRKPAAAR